MAHEPAASSAAKGTAPDLVTLTAMVRALPAVADAAAIIRGRSLKPLARTAAAAPPRSAQSPTANQTLCDRRLPVMDTPRLLSSDKSLSTRGPWTAISGATVPFPLILPAPTNCATIDAV